MVAKLAAKLKEEGNAAFKEQRYLAAAALYTKALKHDSGTNEQTTAVLYRQATRSVIGMHISDLDGTRHLPCHMLCLPPNRLMSVRTKPSCGARVETAATGARRC